MAWPKDKTRIKTNLNAVELDEVIKGNYIHDN